MSLGFEHELRLLHFILLNAIVLFTAWRFVRRAGVNDPIAAMLPVAPPARLAM